MNTHNFTLVNCDTDSISFAKPNGAPFSAEEQASLLAELNSNYPEKIKWEHDGMYEKVVILKAKNYILQKDGKVTKKGSSLKSSKIEPRLKDFMSEIIECLLTDAQDNIIDVYHKYVREVHNLQNIKGWASKKTLTEKVLNPERLNEQKVLDALNGRSMQMGDKLYVYYAEVKTTEAVTKYKSVKKVKTPYLALVETIENPLVMVEDWDAANPNHSVPTLLKKIYNTLVIFSNVIKIEQFPKYHLKGKAVQDALRGIVG